MKSAIGFKFNKITATIILALYGNSIFLSPLVLAVENVSKFKQGKLLPYTIVEGDTLYSLSKRNNLTIDELILINKGSPNPIISAKEIKVGQVIYLPEKENVFNLPDLGSQKGQSEKIIDKHTIAQNLNRVGSQFSTGNDSSQYSSYIKSVSEYNNNDTYSNWLIGNGDDRDGSANTSSRDVVDNEIKYWEQQGVSLVESKAEKVINDQFQRFGTAEIEINLNQNLDIDDYGINFLAPLIDVDNYLFFSQIGVHHKKFNGHTTVNMGIGQRHFFESWMLGYNAFWDALLSDEKTPGHQRLGMGFESWADNIKFSANYYFPLSDWKDSLILNNYEERAAKGFDILTVYYLKHYPQLGFNAKYEQYFGGEVDILNNGIRLHNPSAGSLGVEWQPFPLLSLNVDHTWAASQDDNTLATLNFNWQIGASFSEMLDPEKVAKTRNLQGMRYDSVERNNNIVLEYKEKARVVTVKHSPVVGVSGQVITLNPVVSISNGNIVKYHWMSPDPMLNNGLNNIYSKNASLTLPKIPLEFLSSGFDFPLYLKVEDEKGNTYESDKIAVKVTIDNETVVERILSLTPEIAVDSIDKPDVSINGFPEKFVLEWVFLVHDKDDLSNWEFYKPNDVELTTLKFFDVERLPGRYAEYSYGSSESKKVWIEKLEFTLKSGTLTAKTFKEKFNLRAVGPSNRSSSISLDITLDNQSAAPQITDLHLAGKLEVGQSLSATYGFNANGGDSNDKSTYAWGNKGDTAATVAAGASVSTTGQVPAVSLTAADIGEIKEVSVQAKNGLAITGNTLTVDSSQGAGNGDDTTGGSDTDGDGKGDSVIDPAAGPQIADLRMAGKLEVGQSLSATYGFNANGGDSNDKSTYVWGNKGDTAATVAAGASVSTTGQVPAVSLTAADIGEIKEVSVQAKNGLAITGNTLTVDSSQGAGNGDDTTGGSDTDGDGKGDTVIDPAAGPQIADLRMAGKLEVGQSLTATYGFNANGGDSNDKSTYVWGNKGDTAATVAAGASVSTTGQVPAVSLTAADIGEIKEVSVQAKNGLAITGNTLTVDSSQGAGNGDDTTGGSDTDGDGKGDTVIDPAAGPQIADLRLAGKLEVGQSLSATYGFNANGGDSNDKSTYVWGNKGDTAATVAAGASVSTTGQVPAVSLTAADIGEIKEVSVQAKNGLAITGNTLTVDSSQGAGNGDDTTGGSDTDGDGKGDTVIDPAAGPQIADLRLAGKLEVGQSLTATYGFNANGGDSNDKSTYAWGNKGDTAATVAASASVSTSGQVPAVSLTAADIGEIKEVSVQAKNGLAITGNTLTVDSSQGAGNGDDTTGGGNGGEVLDPNNIQVAIHYTSSATVLVNGTNGGVYTGSQNIRAVANVDQMTAMCQIAGESSMSPCDTRFNLNWYVDGRIVPGATNQKFTPVVTDQGFPVAVEATLKP